MFNTIFKNRFKHLTIEEERAAIWAALPDATVIEGRGAYGAAFHLGVKDDSDWLARCGTELVEKKSVQTVDGVVASLPMQHDGWFWCSKCVSDFTGLSPEEIRAARKK